MYRSIAGLLIPSSVDLPGAAGAGGRQEAGQPPPEPRQKVTKAFSYN